MVHTLGASTSMLAFTIGGGTDWLGVFTTNLDNLTTQNGGALSQIGSLFLTFVATMMLVKMVIQWNTASMSFSINPLFSSPLQGGQIVTFLFRLTICALMETYWVNPIPGAGFGLSHLFSYCAAQIVQTLDQNSLSNLQTLLQQAGDGTQAPSLLQIDQIVCYYLVVCILGAAQGILFLINISGFILYAVCALFGPIFIPLYLTESFRGKFLRFVEVLLSLAMVRAVAAAFVFVWAGFMSTFIQQTFAGDYSLKMWLANFIPVAMVFICFIVNMLYVPTITQMIFGGGAGLVGGAERAIMRGLAEG